MKTQLSLTHSYMRTHGRIATSLHLWWSSTKCFQSLLIDHFGPTLLKVNIKRNLENSYCAHDFY